MDKEAPVDQVRAHLINHTHWDREWFLTSIYTNRWIPDLIDRLVEIAGHNPDFHYFLDGQTLVIEDLLQVAPHYEGKVRELVQPGNLVIGPYYCQPDWQLTHAEALLRNLRWGRQDMARYGSPAPQGDEPQAGWLVDTFGHLSQTPQIHRLAGIPAVYIWRGAPQLVPYFSWCGADGSQIFTINLFGGYRNLYGVTHAPEIAIQRLLAEVSKLAAYYPTPDIPLFDGYDLEDNPEDPRRFYMEHAAELPVGIHIQEDTPGSFARELRQHLPELPIIRSELNSGKYGAVFPGTLSARTYLKVMAWDCEHLLYALCEPLAALASQEGRPYPAAQFEGWSRALLQNAVHDCICGVSIDQVHEKMEYSYQRIFSAMQAELEESLGWILADFAPGLYAASTNPYSYKGWQVAGDRLYQVETGGIGLWKLADGLPLEPVQETAAGFTWENAFYTARLLPDGTVQAGSATLGKLSVYAERGDAYTDETGDLLGDLQPVGNARVLYRGRDFCQVQISFAGQWDSVQVSATAILTFDPSPLIRWQISVDSRGVDFHLAAIFDTGQAGQILAGMPFDVVARPAVDGNLLPRELEEGLSRVLLGQRELGAVRTFPFHEFAAISNGMRSAAVLARGLHAYQADEAGRITLTLRRAVEWLTRPDLETRVGDAGPFFYVPDARAERSVTHELAVLLVDGGVSDPGFQAWNAAFQNSPLLVQAHGTGSRTHLQFFQEHLPLSSLHVAQGRVLARLSNPAQQPFTLSKPYRMADVWGSPGPLGQVVPPKGIVTLDLGELPPESQLAQIPEIRLLNPPLWRVGENQGLPDPLILEGLAEKIARLEHRVAELASQPAPATERKRYHRQHQIYVLERELLEYRLSLRLNEVKRGMGGLSEDYLYQPDEEIAALGRRLNQLRIKRRIYDYVVQAV